MSRLIQHLAFTLVAIVAGGLLASSAVFFVDWEDGLSVKERVQQVWWAVLTVLPVSLYVVFFLHRRGTAPAAILLATGLRFGLTLGLAGVVAWKFSSLRTLTFFLSITVVYLAGLYVETWLVWQDYRKN